MNWGPNSFKFFNAWNDHGDFLSCMERSWTLDKVRGKVAFVLKEKLKMLKANLRVWNKEVFS